MLHQILILLGLTSGVATGDIMKYLVSCPSLVRPGQVYSIRVSIYGVTGPDSSVQVHASVVIDNYPVYNNGGTSAHEGYVAMVSESTESIVFSGTVKTKPIDLDIPNTMASSLPYGQAYFIRVTGRGGVQFTKQAKLDVVSKNMSIFIQTDKAMYKPGDTVKFRAFSVTPDLFPLKNPFTIEIYDSSGTKIKKWINEESTSGVISKEFLLSDQPVLGKWKIKVITQGMEFNQHFLIKEFILPKFEVKTILSSRIPKNVDGIKGSIVAKYPYGKPVGGTVHMVIRRKPDSRCRDTLYPDSLMYRYSWRNAPDCPMRDVTSILVDGRYDFFVDKVQLLDLIPRSVCSSTYSWQSSTCTINENHFIGTHFEILANITEYGTSRTVQSNSEVTVSSQNMIIDFIEGTPPNYKPQLNYTAFVQLSLPDGSIPGREDVFKPDGSNRGLYVYADMICPYSWQTQTPCTAKRLGPFSFDIMESGHSQITLPTPKYEYQYMKLVVTCKDKYHEISRSTRHIYRFMSKSGLTMEVITQAGTGPIKAGELAKFSIQTAEEISSFEYLIMGRGSIVKQQRMVFGGSPSKSRTFTITVDSNMAHQVAPAGRLVVWYISRDNEVVADSTEFSVEIQTPNEVNVHFGVKETTPGSDIDLSVQASAGSYVGILAVDQSVKYLGTGNDMTLDKVTSELHKYDPNSQAWRNPTCPTCYYGSTSARDTHSTLRGSSLIMLTDAYIDSKNDMQPGHTTMRPTMMPWTQQPWMTSQSTVSATFPATTTVPPGWIQNGGVTAAAAGSTAAACTEASCSAPPTDGRSPLVDVDVNSIREDFPETWLWIDRTVGSDGRLQQKVTLPETITSWVASAFALSVKKGLGVAAPATVRGFQSFFISVSLPYSVIRGEEFLMNVTVFNYLSAELYVVVTLKRSGDYYALHRNTEVSQDVRRAVRVRSGMSETVSFWLIPRRVGSISVEVHGQSSKAADAVKKVLLVYPEGREESYTVSRLVLMDGGKIPNVISIKPDYPSSGIVPHSERITVTALGHVMGPALANLGGLLRMPTGCGEQNMVGFTPNIYVMRYLTDTGKLQDKLAQTATKYMNIGYQRELSYMHNDGSFSAFGKRDQYGSTWLTAFVVKSFKEASEFIDIDPTVIERGANFLTSQQDSDGKFLERHQVHSSFLSGGSSRGVALTAYIIVSLLDVIENQDDTQPPYNNIKASIQRAVWYLENRLSSSEVQDSSYTLAIVTYSLALADSYQASYAVSFLQQKEIKNGIYVHFGDQDDNADSVPFYRQRTMSRNVEATAWALLAYNRLKSIEASLSLTHYLSKKQTATGGFASTQDTVVALEALAAVSSKIEIRMGQQNMNIRVRLDDTESSLPTITSDNKMVLHQVEHSGYVEAVEISSTGSGLAMIQVTVTYNMKEEDGTQDIDLIVISEAINNAIKLQVCFRWQNPYEQSGMAVVEIEGLSGYESDISLLEKYKTSGLDRVETMGRKIVTYWSEFTQSRVCVDVNQELVSVVSNVQRGKVTAYSYYSPDKTKMVFYMPKSLIPTDPCYICPMCCDPNPADIDEPDEEKPVSFATRNMKLPLDLSFIITTFVTLHLISYRSFL